MNGGRTTWLWLIALLGIVSLSLASCGGRQARLIPRDVLFGNPERARARISPDGERMAYLAPSEGVMNVWVRTIGDEDDRVVTADRGSGVYQYFWAHDGQHIMYLQDSDGDENWHLYAVDLRNDELRDLTPYEGVQTRLVDVSKQHPTTIVVSMNRQDERLHDVYRLDVNTGELTMAARNPGNVVGWVTDYGQRVRGALAANPEGGYDLLTRENEDASWGRLLSWGSEDSMTSFPVGFTMDGGSIYLVDSRNANAGRLVELDLGTREMRVIAEDPTYDVGDVMMNPDTYEIEAVSFTRARSEWKVLDESLQADFEAIRELDRGDFVVNSRDHADRKWLLSFIKDNGPIAFYAYDRDTKDGTFLFDHRPELNEYELAEMEPVSFNARDGFTIHGYATFPVTGGRENLPTVLNVHGGPWARDSWGYHPEAQWFANRGYLCLQVNFRGSTGYGKRFLNAGDHEWGGKMHDDLIDAVNWAVEQGYADPDRVAIYGGSYGGYASLVGATFTPDVFCCAVSMMGPSNLVTFIRSIPPYWTAYLEIMHQRIGNPKTEREFLESRSPLFRVDQIEIPMLIAQGANDPRVKQEESEQMVAAMRDRGIDVEYMLFEDEGHGFAKPENRLEFYAATERFLAEHLGGRYEEGPPAAGDRADE